MAPRGRVTVPAGPLFSAMPIRFSKSSVLVGAAGFEPALSRLRTEYPLQAGPRPAVLVADRRIELRPHASKAWMHPLHLSASRPWWAGRDSNPRRPLGHRVYSAAQFPLCHRPFFGCPGRNRTSESWFKAKRFAINLRGISFRFGRPGRIRTLTDWVGASYATVTPRTCLVFSCLCIQPLKNPEAFGRSGFEGDILSSTSNPEAPPDIPRLFRLADNGAGWRRGARLGLKCHAVHLGLPLCPTDHPSILEIIPRIPCGVNVYYGFFLDYPSIFFNTTSHSSSPSSK